MGHEWFESTTGKSVTSHNGQGDRTGRGKRAEFVDAYDAGYRWFQVDALPIRGDLLSMHSVFGSRRRYLDKTRAQVAQILPDVPSISELLSDDALGGAMWNIELKSQKGLPALLELIAALPADFDRRRLLISSPVRPSVLREVDGKFPTVALAAPLPDGGVFGWRFPFRKRAQLADGREYDCQQIWHPFVRGVRVQGPVRQAWTVGRARTLDRLGRTDAHVIVDGGKLGLEHKPGTDVVIDPAKQVDALALGGGGWRGAFGGIGAVSYFEQARWDEVDQVVGISGGSFAVGALSSEGVNGADRAAVAEAMSTLAAKLERAGRSAANFLNWGVVLAAIVILGIFTLGGWLNNDHPAAGLVVLFGTLLSLSFLLRLAASLRWRAMVHSIIGRERMRGGAERPRLAIGSTGLHDGRLYSFTTDVDRQRQRYEDAPNQAAIPLGRRPVADAVVRATSLPGLGQLGFRRLYLCDHAQDEHDGCKPFPDRLVDGGTSGIFGRGLLDDPPADQRPRLVIIDAGRSLIVDRGTSGRDLLAGLGQRASSLALLARWLQTTLDVGYQSEMRTLHDAALAIPGRYDPVLIRLAESAIVAQPGNPQVPVVTRQRMENNDRLYLLRDRVHQFGLRKSGRLRCNRAITVAVAACALTFEQDPNMEALLARVGQSLVRPDGSNRGDELVEVWRSMAVLGQPTI